MKIEYTDGDIFEIKLNFNLGYIYAKIRKMNFIDESFALGTETMMFPYYFFPLLKLNNEPVKEFNMGEFQGCDHLCGLFGLVHPPIFGKKFSWRKIGNAPLESFETIIPYTRASFMDDRFFKNEEKANWFCCQTELIVTMDGAPQLDKTIRNYQSIKHLTNFISIDSITAVKYLTFVYMFELGKDPFDYIKIEDFSQDRRLESMYNKAKHTVLYKGLPKSKWNMISTN